MHHEAPCAQEGDWISVRPLIACAHGEAPFVPHTFATGARYSSVTRVWTNGFGRLRLGIVTPSTLDCCCVNPVRTRWGIGQRRVGVYFDNVVACASAQFRTCGRNLLHRHTRRAAALLLRAEARTHQELNLRAHVVSCCDCYQRHHPHLQLCQHAVRLVDSVVCAVALARLESGRWSRTSVQAHAAGPRWFGRRPHDTPPRCAVMQGCVSTRHGGA